MDNALMKLLMSSTFQRGTIINLSSSFHAKVISPWTIGYLSAIAPRQKCPFIFSSSRNYPWLRSSPLKMGVRTIFNPALMFFSSCVFFPLVPSIHLLYAFMCMCPSRLVGLTYWLTNWHSSMDLQKNLGSSAAAASAAATSYPWEGRKCSFRRCKKKGFRPLLHLAWKSKY